MSSLLSCVFVLLLIPPIVSLFTSFLSFSLFSFWFPSHSSLSSYELFFPSTVRSLTFISSVFSLFSHISFTSGSPCILLPLLIFLLFLFVSLFSVPILGFRFFSEVSEAAISCLAGGFLLAVNIRQVQVSPEPSPPLRKLNGV